MTYPSRTHPGSSVRARVQDLTDHHGTLRATATAVGISYDTLSRILRIEHTTVQEPTYKAILKAHRAMQRAETVDGDVVAEYATTAEARAFIAECRGAA